MLRSIVPAALLLAIFSLGLGLVYPLTITAVAQMAAPQEANGSRLLNAKGQVVGSALIGQAFEDPRYFWSRPSATGPAYNAGASTGSNLGPANPALHKAVQERKEALLAAHPQHTGAIPVDLVTASGSGLDPHISPAAAGFQVARVAAARQLPVTLVEQLVQTHVQGRTLGVLGESVVAVLPLNLALDALQTQGSR